MYLSRVTLDATMRETMRAIASPNILHGAVERCFDGEKDRRLWRIDWLNDQCFLLLLSRERPDCSKLSEQFNPNALPPKAETRDYTPLLNRLAPNQTWHFRLLANPVVSAPSAEYDPKKRGKVLAHVTPFQQKMWLMKRAEKCGFALSEDAFDVVHTKWADFKKHGDGNRVTLRTAAFEGELTITDTALFTNALLHGIGRGKAYGCGLLTIAGCNG